VFPYELDLLDWLTDDLKAKLLPINVRLKEIEKARTERRNIRRKTKLAVSPGAPVLTGSAPIATTNDCSWRFDQRRDHVGWC
jgi:ubiquitin carboxyl-terminal hydrolase 14